MAKKGAKRDGSKSQAIADYMAANPGQTVKEVLDGLKAQGTSVSLGLVNKVKYSGPAAGGAKPGRKKPAKAARVARTAKKTGRRGRPAGGGSTTSDAIRAYMAAHPNASRPEIRRGLAAQGKDVSASLVNAVYVRARAAGAVASTPRRGPAPKAASAGSISAEQLIDAKHFVDQLGGVEKVRQALALLEKLR